MLKSKEGVLIPRDVLRTISLRLTLTEHGQIVQNVTTRYYGARQACHIWKSTIFLADLPRSMIRKRFAHLKALFQVTVPHNVTESGEAELGVPVDDDREEKLLSLSTSTESVKA